MPPLTAGDVLMFLLILLSLMGVVVLYHLLFLAVDLRRIVKRVNALVKQVEETILKPIAIMDHVITALIDVFDASKKKKEGKQGGIFHQRHVK